VLLDRIVDQVGIVDQEVKQVKAEDFTTEGAEERRREKQVPRRVAKSATLARDDDASSRRQIVDQRVKQVKARWHFTTEGAEKSVFSREDAGLPDKRRWDAHAGGNARRYKEGVAASRRKDYSPQGFADAASKSKERR
jgi:hypothetical protein